MNITSVDERNDLFVIDNLINENLLKELDSIDFSKGWAIEKQEGQEEKPRSIIKSKDVLNKIAFDIFAKLKTIGKSVGADFTSIDWNDFADNRINFWLDNAGFELGQHLDDKRIKWAMQVYLWGDAVGTTFYNYKDPNADFLQDISETKWICDVDKEHLNVRHKFAFKSGSGYLMKQNKNQIHGLEQSVQGPRLSCYVWLDY